MRVFHGETFPYVYTNLLRALLDDPDHTKAPRGLPCYEIMPAILQFPVTRDEDGTFESPARSTDWRYLAGELMWYYHGENHVSTIMPYSKFWTPLANPDGTLNSAYGWHLFKKKNEHNFTEWQWAMEQLHKDPDTRQAVMFIGNTGHHKPGNKDMPCTLNIAFQRRNEFLDMTVVMRSNDVWFGVPYDIPFFISLLKNACFLQGMTPGEYTHIALNMHLYAKDRPRVERMVADGITAPEEHMPLHENSWLTMTGDIGGGAVRDPLWQFLKGVSQWK